VTEEKTMADIDVVKKDSGSKVWLWILMIAVIAFVVWFLMGGMQQPQQTGRQLNETMLSTDVAQVRSELSGMAQS
jgi:Tfp pilus assembly protein PilN